MKPLFAENLSGTRISTVSKQNVQFQKTLVENGRPRQATAVRRVGRQGGVGERIQNPKEDAEVRICNNQNHVSFIAKK